MFYPEDSNFSSLLETVEVEVQKEMTRDESQASNNKVCRSSLCLIPHIRIFLLFLQSYTSDEIGMVPRIAHLEDKLEKRDKIIMKLKKDNAALKVKFSCDAIIFCSRWFDFCGYRVHAAIISVHAIIMTMPMKHLVGTLPR